MATAYPEAALLLESARTYRAPLDDGCFPWMYPLVATLLLTGGRKLEVFGLELDDVSLTHGKLHFRPNQWRRMKTRGSERSMPLWPQLEEILRTYLLERERDGGIEGPLLFPSTRRGGGRMLNDIRKALDTIAKRAGFAEGRGNPLFCPIPDTNSVTIRRRGRKAKRPMDP